MARTEILSRMSDERVVVITGGSRGIGLAIADVFAEAKFRVIILGREASRLGSAIDQLKPLGHLAESLVCDVADPVSVEAAFRSIGAKHKHIDVLVNNAGVAHALAPAGQLGI